MDSYVSEVLAANPSGGVIVGKNHMIYGWPDGVSCFDVTNPDFSDILTSEVDKNSEYNAPDKLTKAIDGNCLLSGGIDSEQSFISTITSPISGFDLKNFSGVTMKDGNIDYDAEFKKYMASRDCEDEDELKTLNQFNGQFRTKDDLINFAKTQLVLASSPQYQDFDSIISSHSLSDVANYVKKTLSGECDVKKAMTSFQNTYSGGETVGSFLEENSRNERLSEIRQYKNNLGTYVPESLDSQEIVNAMSFYEKNQINSLDDFKKAFDVQVDSYYKKNPTEDKSKKPDYDYNEAFNQYMNYRGCTSVGDLQALNRTEFKTVTGLLGALKGTMDTVSRLLSTQGITLSQKDQATLLSGRSVSDLVGLYQSGVKPLMDAFQNFVKNAPDTAKSIWDDKLKNKMFGVPSALDALYAAVDKGDAEQKEVAKETSTTKDKTESPTPKAQAESDDSGYVSDYVKCSLGTKGVTIRG